MLETKPHIGDPVRSTTGRRMTVMRVVEEGETGDDGELLTPGVWVCFEDDGQRCVGLYKRSQLDPILVEC